LAQPVLAHRILPRAARPGGSADAAEEIIARILEATPVPL
jgi:hypothetical protein